MKPTLDEMIEVARSVKVTPEMAAEQRLSFVYGNCAFENPLITREMVERVDREMRGVGQGTQHG